MKKQPDIVLFPSSPMNSSESHATPIGSRYDPTKEDWYVISSGHWISARSVAKYGMLGGDVVCFSPDIAGLQSRVNWERRKELIAAAPRLYRMLCEMSEALGNHVYSSFIGSDEYEKHGDLLDEVNTFLDTLTVRDPEQ